jgi:hypothetical protein
MNSGQRSLDDYSKRGLQHHVFSGCDAAVVFVPEGQSPTPEVRTALERGGRQRWYPVAGGHMAKIEFHTAAGSEHLFQFEKGGWDHEHCDFCSQSIPAGQTCWTTPDANFVVFCEECYRKLKPE